MVFLRQYLLWLHVTTNNPVQHLVQILYIIYINILFSKQHTGQCNLSYREIGNRKYGAFLNVLT